MLDFGVALFLLAVHFFITEGYFNLEGEQLVQWQEKYMEKMWYFVIPLFPIHLAVIGLQNVLDPSFYSIGSGLLVISCWVVTIGFISPLLNTLATGVDVSLVLRQKLYRFSWYRAIVPSIVFIWSFIEIIILGT
tara:strand:- start:979 stop:1380 length:402 start_codon:yes stop_codon:yes gene_type:complete